MLANYHTHTTFSDGHASPAEYLEAALGEQMPAIGFSDHAPLPFANNFAIVHERLQEYADAIDELSVISHVPVSIWKGLEIDYIPELIYPGHPGFDELNLDFTIGAVHYVDYYPDGKPWNVDGSTLGFAKGLKEIFHGDVRAAVARYYELQYELITRHTPDILAHMDRIKRHNFDHRFFSAGSEWYISAVRKVLEAMAEHGTILEINTKGFYSYGEPEFYPSRDIVELAFQLDIPVHPAADAHQPHHLQTAFVEVLEMLIDVGYTEIHQFDGHAWVPVPLAVPALG